ncbi:enoyl-CoA hydratase-related protein [Amycolatopsis acidiphila]|uniref:Enoyl-CoA hydratase n=1 Tax=Amycolatopsis acidiphila TaxID=715473 RepID=A0A558A9I3_9PSEU|nr:enoyl-CoA hydratase-related protein [Amycolatopsis acidiphila]TVT20921.1 enoyl-CoA hydratase [Amycolatopsis acidiphila]UIJ62979.1 enoyl-CoA hydratase-related protein [Amycolatopsis acidiphila]GHG65430.1 enoyl-CoA hydratase [Amycolatopsis acidiphila]
MGEPVRYEVAGGVATLTLDQPGSMNTMNPEMLTAVTESLELAAADAAVRVLVMTGSGRAFCAGGNLNGFAAGRGTELPVPTRIGRLRTSMRTSQLLAEMPKPTIAAINGACAGAGFSWACAADLRYCAESARFNTAFLTAGLSGDFGGSWTLPRIVGPAKAREMYLLPSKFDGREAERIGLVNGCVPDPELAGFVAEVAARLAAAAPLAVAAIKQNFNDSLTDDFSAHLDREADRHARLQYTEDAKEAAAAFLAKRAPEFKGR